MKENIAALKYFLNLRENIKNDKIRSFMPSLDRLWCKGEKTAYKICLNRIAQSLDNRFHSNLFKLMPNENTMYPVSRNITRYHYNSVKTYDKYLWSNDGAIATISDTVSMPGILVFPERIHDVEISMFDNDKRKQVKIADASKIECNISPINGTIELIYFNMTLAKDYDPSIFYAKNASYVDHIPIKIFANGEPFSVECSASFREVPFLNQANFLKCWKLNTNTNKYECSKIKFRTNKYITYHL